MSGTTDVISAIRRLEAAKTRTTTVAARAAGINPTSWSILSELAVDGTLTNGQIANRLGMSTGGVTPALDRLERDGLAQRRPNPSDRRSSVIDITDAGSAMLARVHADISRRLEPIVEAMAEAERGAVQRFLDLVTGAYAETHAELRGGGQGPIKARNPSRNS